MKFQCPCCMFYTLDENNRHDICPVCFWEDDPVMYDYPDWDVGANGVSLNHARISYQTLGVSEFRFIFHVRPPTADERIDTHAAPVLLWG